MKQFKSNLPILIDKFSQHSLYKNSLMSHFEKEELMKENYEEDSIYKVDWNRSQNFQRPWVEMIYKDLHKHFLKYANHMGFKDCNINELWFQQYDKKATHSWHTHGHNYTGVYYVNYNKDCAKTRIIDPITKETKDIDADEGDIVIFPSIIVHRSLVQNIDFLKTIISFNISFDGINHE